MVRKTERILRRGFITAALAVIGYLAFTTVYSSDDYAYSLYFDNGLLGYWPLAKAHYENVNGRALVHLFAHALLEFDNVVFCLVCLGCVLAVPAMAAPRWEMTLEAKERGMCVYLLLFAAMPASIMTQGVMWISAFCNYVIPCVMVVGLAVLLMEKPGPWGRWLIPVLALACGATTEQMGAVSMGVIALLLLARLVRREGSPLFLAGNLICAGVGYGTIFLSPSTQGRLLRETAVGEPTGMLDSLLAGFTRQTELLSVTAAVAVVISVVFLAWSLFRRNGWSAVLAGAGTAAVWGGYLLDGTAGLVCWAVVYVLLAAVGLWLIWERMELPGLLLIAAVASACMMMPTQSNRSRCFLPMYLLLCAAAGLLAARAGEGRKSRRWIPLLSGLMIFSILSAMPTLDGYRRNYAVDRINAAHVAEAAQGGPVYYCMDYDKAYTDSKPYDSGGAYEDYYLQTVGLDPDTTQVLYYKTGCPAVYLDGQRMRFPAYELQGRRYLPLRCITEGAGGTVELDSGKLVITLNGEVCTVDYQISGSARTEWPGGSGAYFCDTNLAGFYLEEDFFREILGFEIDWTADEVNIAEK